MSQADGYVLPKPGIPKTLGILNVIFGVLGILFGLCMLGFLAAAPALMQFAEKTQKDVQAKAEAQKQTQVAAFDEREKAATTDEEKAAIRQERDAAIAAIPQVPAVDMSAASSQFKDPTVLGFSYVQFGITVLLSIATLVAGIGLIRLTEWGRSMAMIVAVMGVASLWLLTAAGVFYVQPMLVDGQNKMLAQMEANAQAPNAAPGAADAVKMSRAMSNPGMTKAISIVSAVVFSIYPIVVLALLSQPGARAACRGPKPEQIGNF